MIRARVNFNFIKLYLIQSKNGIVMNVDVNVKNLMNGITVKKIMYGFLVCVIVSLIKRVEFMNT